MNRFILKSIIFLTLPLVLGEALIYFKVIDRYWGVNIEDAFTKTSGRKLFLIGSSRVAQGVVSQEITKVFKEQYHLEVSAHNLGIPGASLATCYLMVKSLLATDPDVLRGSVVLIESLFGNPASQTWNGDWFGSKNGDGFSSENVNGPYVRPEDISRILHASADRMSKFQLVLGSILKSTLQLHRLQAKFSRQGEELALKAFYKLRTVMLPNRPTMTNDSLIPGGKDIRTDTPAMRHHRKFILGYYLKLEIEMKARKPIENWEETVDFELLELIKNAGGKPVFFETFSSSHVLKPFLYATPQTDKTNFNKVLRKWNIPLITVEMKHNDDDFPDYSHLDDTRTGEYSRLLAHEIVKQEIVSSHASLTKNRPKLLSHSSVR